MTKIIEPFHNHTQLELMHQKGFLEGEFVIHKVYSSRATKLGGKCFGGN